MRTSAFLALASLLATIATAAPVKDAKRAKEQEVRRTLDKIKTECGITTGQFSYDSNGISLVYDGMIEREKLDCASDLTTLVGVDFESYDTSAPYSGPTRFILKAPAPRLAMVEKEVASSGDWKIIHRADAGDGIAYLEIEIVEGISRSNARKFLDRFVGSDLSDVAVGLAPRTIYGHDKPSTEATFRQAGRAVYAAVKNNSCGAPLQFRRDELIAPERELIADLEKKFAGTVAGAHLRIAREDSEYIQPMCWADDDIRFARIHLNGDKDAINRGAQTMRELAPALTGVVPDPPKNAAVFRNGVRSIVEYLDPKCRWTSKGSNKAVLAAANAELSGFETRLRGTPYAKQFRISKVDTEHDRAWLIAECDDPAPTPVAALSNKALEHARVEIRKLEDLSRPAK